MARKGDTGSQDTISKNSPCLPHDPRRSRGVAEEELVQCVCDYMFIQVQILKNPQLFIRNNN